MIIKVYEATSATLHSKYRYSKSVIIHVKKGWRFRFGSFSGIHWNPWNPFIHILSECLCLVKIRKKSLWAVWFQLLLQKVKTVIRNKVTVAVPQSCIYWPETRVPYIEAKHKDVKKGGTDWRFYSIILFMIETFSCFH